VGGGSAGLTTSSAVARRVGREGGGTCLLVVQVPRCPRFDERPAPTTADGAGVNVLGPGCAFGAVG
jgi:hypothetical protein